MNITCIFEESNFPQESFYQCAINYQQIVVRCCLSLSGKHKKGKSNKDVTHVRFNDCNMKRVPQGLTKIFPNMKEMEIFNSIIKNIRKEDIAEYKLLEGLFFHFNSIEFLPADLFEGFENIKSISFKKNNLKIIEPTIFDRLDKLNSVDLTGNINYSILYSDCVKNNTHIKEDLKQIFFKIILENIQLYKALIKEEFKSDKDQPFISNFMNDPSIMESLIVVMIIIFIFIYIIVLK